MRFWEYIGARLTYRGIIKIAGQAQKRGFFTLTNVFLILLVITLVIAVLIYLLGKMERGNSEEVWKQVEVGDSLFVQDHGLITFYKKGRTKLSGNVQRELKYTRIDTINFVSQNYIGDRYFYSVDNSFIGICLGLDSMTTTEGRSSVHKWIRIQPANALVEFKPDANYSTFHWRDKASDILSTVPLSKEFYVKAADVQLMNNDNTFAE